MNIFCRDSTDFPKVKIGDFGLATKLAEGQKVVQKVGTLAFTAPEVLKKEAYDYKCDVWSLGIICFTLVASSLPFATSKSEEKLIRLISEKEVSFKGSIWSSISDECIDLISKMLTKDQHARISMAEVVQHPWMLND